MAADNLTATLDGPDLIVVGISDADPRRDYLPVLPDGTTPSGADSFLRFVADELVPFLDKACAPSRSVSWWHRRPARPWPCTP